ncbi:hypothetical protein, partial [Amycolatopsis minnesotensis]
MPVGDLEHTGPPHRQTSPSDPGGPGGGSHLEIIGKMLWKRDDSGWHITEHGGSFRSEATDRSGKPFAAELPAGTKMWIDVNGEPKLLLLPTGKSYDRAPDGHWSRLREREYGEIFLRKLHVPRLVKLSDGTSTLLPIATEVIWDRQAKKAVYFRKKDEGYGLQPNGKYKLLSDPGSRVAYESWMAGANLRHETARKLLVLEDRYNHADPSSRLDQLTGAQLREMVFFGSPDEKFAAAYEMTRRHTDKSMYWGQVDAVDQMRENPKVDIHYQMRAGEGKTLAYLLASILEAVEPEFDGIHLLTSNDYLATIASVHHMEILGDLGFTLHWIDSDRPPPVPSPGRPTIYIGSVDEAAHHLNKTGRLPGEAHDGSTRLRLFYDEGDTSCLTPPQWILSFLADKEASPYVAGEVMKAKKVLDDWLATEKQPDRPLTKEDFGHVGNKRPAQSALTVEGRVKVEKLMGHSLSLEQERRINNAARVRLGDIKLDEDYVIDFTTGEGRVVLVNRGTGDAMSDPKTGNESRWNEGLGQAVEAEWNLKIRADSDSSNSRVLTAPEFFGRYPKVTAMSGTMEGMEPLLKSIGLPGAVRRIPNRFLDDMRENTTVHIMPDLESKFKYVNEFVHVNPEPTLIISHDNAKIKKLSDYMNDNPINGKSVEHTAVDIKWLLKQKADRYPNLQKVIDKVGGEIKVLIGTDIVGRGADIDAWNLDVILLEPSGLHPNVDDQGMSRTRRNGKDGRAQVLISPEDDAVQNVQGSAPQVSIIKYVESLEENGTHLALDDPAAVEAARKELIETFESLGEETASRFTLNRLRETSTARGDGDLGLDNDVSGQEHGDSQRDQDDLEVERDEHGRDRANWPRVAAPAHLEQIRRGIEEVTNFVEGAGNPGTGPATIDQARTAYEHWRIAAGHTGPTNDSAFNAAYHAVYNGLLLPKVPPPVDTDATDDSTADNAKTPNRIGPSTQPKDDTSARGGDIPRRGRNDSEADRDEPGGELDEPKQSHGEESGEDISRDERDAERRADEPGSVDTSWPRVAAPAHLERIRAELAELVEAQREAGQEVAAEPITIERARAAYEGWLNSGGPDRLDSGDDAAFEAAYHAVAPDLAVQLGKAGTGENPSGAEETQPAPETPETNERARDEERKHDFLKHGIVFARSEMERLAKRPVSHDEVLEAFDDWLALERSWPSDVMHLADEVAQVGVNPERQVVRRRGGAIGTESEVGEVQLTGPVLVRGRYTKLVTDSLVGGELIPEKVGEPAGVLRGEQGRPDPAKVWGEFDRVLRLLRDARPDQTIADLFGNEDGFSVGRGEQTQVKLQDLGLEQIAQQLTVGVPVFGLWSFLKAVAAEAREEGVPADALEARFLKQAMTFGQTIADEFREYADYDGYAGLSFARDEGVEADATAIAGYAALVYTQAAVATLNWEKFGGNDDDGTDADLMKNFTMVLSRMPMSVIRGGLPRRVQHYLENNAEELTIAFDRTLRGRNQDLVRDDRIREHALDRKMCAGGSPFSPRDYLRQAWQSLRPGEKPVPQSHAVGGLKTEINELDSYGDRAQLPLGAFELRYLRNKLGAKGFGSAYAQFQRWMATSRRIDDEAWKAAAASRAAENGPEPVLSVPPALPDVGPVRLTDEPRPDPLSVTFENKKFEVPDPSKLENFADEVLEQAAAVVKAGGEGLVVHVEGGGNGGLRSKGAAATGNERARVVADILERRLNTLRAGLTEEESAPVRLVTSSRGDGPGRSPRWAPTSQEDRRQVRVWVEPVALARPGAAGRGHTLSDESLDAAVLRPYVWAAMERLPELGSRLSRDQLPDDEQVLRALRELDQAGDRPADRARLVDALAQRFAQETKTSERSGWPELDDVRRENIASALKGPDGSKASDAEVERAYQQWQTWRREQEAADPDFRVRPENTGRLVEEIVAVAKADGRVVDPHALLRLPGGAPGRGHPDQPAHFAGPSGAVSEATSHGVEVPASEDGLARWAAKQRALDDDERAAFDSVMAGAPSLTANQRELLTRAARRNSIPRRAVFAAVIRAGAVDQETGQVQVGLPVTPMGKAGSQPGVVRVIADVGTPLVTAGGRYLLPPGTRLVPEGEGYRVAGTSGDRTGLAEPGDAPARTVEEALAGLPAQVRAQMRRTALVLLMASHDLTNLNNKEALEAAIISIRRHTGSVREAMKFALKAARNTPAELSADDVELLLAKARRAQIPRYLTGLADVAAVIHDSELCDIIESGSAGMARLIAYIMHRGNSTFPSAAGDPDAGHMHISELLGSTLLTLRPKEEWDDAIRAASEGSSVENDIDAAWEDDIPDRVLKGAAAEASRHFGRRRLVELGYALKDMTRLVAYTVASKYDEEELERLTKNKLTAELVKSAEKLAQDLKATPAERSNRVRTVDPAQVTIVTILLPEEESPEFDAMDDRGEAGTHNLLRRRIPGAKPVPVGKRETSRPDDPVPRAAYVGDGQDGLDRVISALKESRDRTASAMVFEVTPSGGLGMVLHVVPKDGTFEVLGYAGSQLSPEDERKLSREVRLFALGYGPDGTVIIGNVRRVQQAVQVDARRVAEPLYEQRQRRGTAGSPGVRESLTPSRSSSPAPAEQPSDDVGQAWDFLNLDTAAAKARAVVKRLGEGERSDKVRAELKQTAQTIADNTHDYKKLGETRKSELVEIITSRLITRSPLGFRVNVADAFSWSRRLAGKLRSAPAEPWAPVLLGNGSARPEGIEPVLVSTIRAPNRFKIEAELGWNHLVDVAGPRESRELMDKARQIMSDTMDWGQVDQSMLTAIAKILANRLRFSSDGFKAGYRLSYSFSGVLQKPPPPGSWVPSSATTNPLTVMAQTVWTEVRLLVEAAFVPPGAVQSDGPAVAAANAAIAATHHPVLLAERDIRGEVRKVLAYWWSILPDAVHDKEGLLRQVSIRIAAGLGTWWTSPTFRDAVRDAPSLDQIDPIDQQEVYRAMGAPGVAEAFRKLGFDPADVVRVAAGIRARQGAELGLAEIVMAIAHSAPPAQEQAADDSASGNANAAKPSTRQSEASSSGQKAVVPAELRPKAVERMAKKARPNAPPAEDPDAITPAPEQRPDPSDASGPTEPDAHQGTRPGGVREGPYRDPKLTAHLEKELSALSGRSGNDVSGFVAKVLEFKAGLDWASLRVPSEQRNSVAVTATKMARVLMTVPAPVRDSDFDLALRSELGRLLRQQYQGEKRDLVGELVRRILAFEPGLAWAYHQVPGSRDPANRMAQLLVTGQVHRLLGGSDQTSGGGGPSAPAHPSVAQLLATPADESVGPVRAPNSQGADSASVNSDAGGHEFGLGVFSRPVHAPVSDVVWHELVGLVPADFSGVS